MGIKTLPHKCQIQGLTQMSEPLGRIDLIWQLRYKFKRVLKRRIRYVRNWLTRNGAVKSMASEPRTTVTIHDLVAGQLVRVKSREEIQATLDNWNYLKGCGFMDEMWQYCDTHQFVLKPVQRFLDERDYLVKNARGVVLLEGVHCEGTIDYGRCDRGCYYFWREEWLERVE